MSIHKQMVYKAEKTHNPGLLSTDAILMPVLGRRSQRNPLCEGSNSKHTLATRQSHLCHQPSDAHHSASVVYNDRLNRRNPLKLQAMKTVEQFAKLDPWHRMRRMKLPCVNHVCCYERRILRPNDLKEEIGLLR